ncbi:MAG: MalY/PatB family protein [Eubacteriales bacterium]|nr:MalY/PatB family protein [Eubacteriales bacterium]
MKFNKAFFDEIIDRTQSNSVKWGNRDIMPEDGIPLWVADMDFRCAPAIKEALVKRAKHPVYGYTMVIDECYNSLIGFWERHHNVNINKEDLIMLPSVVSGLRICVNVLTEPNDKVLLLTPIYRPFYSAIEDSGRTISEIVMERDENNRYVLDLEKLEERLSQGIKLFMLCNPHNPVSRPWSKEELSAMAALCKKYNVRLAVDEIHCDFVFPPHEFVSILSIEEAAKNTIAMTSNSKTFNIAGLKQAWLICRDKDTLDKIEKYKFAQGIEAGNIFAMEANMAAYNHGDDWLKGLLKYLQGNQKTLKKFVEEELPKAKLSPMEATYLAWLDISAYETDNDVLAKRFYENGVAVNSGTMFGELTGKGFIRINYACPEKNLIKGLKRLKKALINQK